MPNTPSLTPSRDSDSEPYSSPTPHFSIWNHGPTISPESPPETPSESDHLQLHPAIQVTTSSGSDQLYTLTVPLEDVEFPPIHNVEEIPLFRCRWQNCKFWITSEREAVKSHVTRYDVTPSETVYCEWVGCPSTLQRGGLVRHFKTHLGLKWLCSVCKGVYTRQDSAVFHTRSVPRCQLAQVISHPGAAAYRARINENRTITLTKVMYCSTTLV